MKINMQQRVGEKWDYVDFGEWEGMTLAQILPQYIGEDAICEAVSDNGQIVYICGKLEHVEKLAARGKRAYTVLDFMERLRTKGSPFLTTRCPMVSGTILEEVTEVFSGAKVTDFEFPPQT